jgi:purine-binding chemotaxis protein CheW
MKESADLFTTFYVGSSLFGIEVMRVQEVTGTPSITPVPLAPAFIRGLINLRGQLATALGLKELIGQGCAENPNEMSVVCRMDGNLVSLMVDQIGDVLEVSRDSYESTPDTLPAGVKKFVKGVYKTNESLLSVLDLESIARELSPSLEKSTEEKVNMNGMEKTAHV